MIDFSGQYLPTGDTIVGAVRLELSADADDVVNEVSVAKHGILAQTVTDVTFSAADVTTGHSLTRGTYYVETRWDDTNSNWQFRLVDGSSGNAVSVANLGGAGFTADWQNIRNVTAGSDGSRVFHSGTGLVIEFGAEYQSGSKSTGGAAQLLLGVPDGVPVPQVSLTFDGGGKTTYGLGDTLRIAGDGYATGSVYQPDSSVPGAGTVTVSGNSLAFRGVEPLIVHGLPDFEMLTPDLVAALTIDSAQLADVARQQLQLHTLTVEGQVTWTQKTQFNTPSPALDPRQVGRAIAVSDDGQTMVVGAKAKPVGSADTPNPTDGMVLVYQWLNGAWAEKARLEPSDLRLGLNFGGDFGAAVAIDGNRLIVGAPGDAPANGATVASFIPTFTSINTQDKQIIFANGTTLTDGQRVTYHKGNGYGSIGLTEGQVYYVKRVSDNPNAIQLASSPGGAAVSLTVATTSPDMLGTASFVPSSTTVQNNQIIFPSSTTLTNGQAVTYHNGNGDTSIGLDDGQIYYVKLVSGNPRAVQLAATLELANDPSGAVIPLSIPVRAPDQLKQATTVASFTPTFTNINTSTNRITLPSSTNLTNGQPVAYHKGNGYGDIGLTEGQVYYVNRISGTLIELALTPGGSAVSLTIPMTSLDRLGTASFIPSSTTVQNNQIIFGSNTTLTTGQAVAYQNGNGNASIGLNDGQVYYVKRVDSNPMAIELALTPELANDPAGAVVPLSFPARAGRVESDELRCGVCL